MVVVALAPSHRCESGRVGGRVGMSNRRVSLLLLACSIACLPASVVRLFVGTSRSCVHVL